MKPGAGNIISSKTAQVTSIAIVISNECISILKSRYTILRDWINVVTLLYQKILKQSMVDKKKYEKEALELKKICNHYHDKRKEIMKNTTFRVEDVVG